MTEVYGEPETWDVLDAELQDVLEIAQVSNRKKYQQRLDREARKVEAKEPRQTTRSPDMRSQRPRSAVTHNRKDEHGTSS